MCKFAKKTSIYDHVIRKQWEKQVQRTRAKWKATEYSVNTSLMTPLKLTPPSLPNSESKKKKIETWCCSYSISQTINNNTSKRTGESIFTAKKIEFFH